MLEVNNNFQVIFGIKFDVLKDDIKMIMVGGVFDIVVMFEIEIDK